MGPVLPRIAYVVLVLTVLTSHGFAEAGVSPFWQELGGSASGTGVSQTSTPRAVFDGAVAVDGTGRPVVVYTEYPDAFALQGAITVKQWTGSAWQTLGGPGGIGQGYDPQVRIATTGAIHVAWLRDDGAGQSEVRLRVWTGSTFVPLGNSDSAGGLSGPIADISTLFSLALDAAGNPIVAFLGLAQTGNPDATSVPAIVDSTIQIYVRRWTGATWEFVGGDFTGTDGFAGGGASNARSFRSSIGDVLHDVDSPSLAVDSTGAPVVAFTYFTTIDGVPAANTDIYVTRWNGSAWTAVGPAVPAADGAPGRGGAGGVSNGPSGSYNASLAAAASGKLVLAWEEEPLSGGVYVWVRRWTGTTWEQLAGSATGSGVTQLATTNVLPRVAVDPIGRPLVTWQALTNIDAPAQIFVRRWNGTSAWDEVGFQSARDAGISAAVNDARAPKLALAPTGGVPADAVTIAWLDGQDSGSAEVFLRQSFSGTTFPLTTQVTGSGTLTSDPIGIACSSTSCVASFPSGTSVSLVPQAAPGWTFTTWAGACTGSGPCTVAMTAAQSVSVTFVSVHTLTLTVATPAGTPVQGTVGSIVGPAGACIFGGSAPCVSNVLRGTPVVLQATPQPGNRFLSWSGGPCNGRTLPTCSFTLTANVSTTALFRAVTGVQVLKAGNGAGTVSGTGISCGADCFQEVFTGTSVTLTPTPATGSSFLGWTGDVCNGQATGACVVPTTGQVNRSVTATFQLKKQRLTLTVTGGGSATSSPSGIDCGNAHTDCALDYDYGTVVTLTPVADVDSMLSGWTGCTSRSGALCTVTMTANRAITGKFIAAHTLTVAASGNGSGKITTATPPGLTCISDCSTSQLFPATASVVLTPQPAVGTGFRWVSGDCSGTAACTTPMSVNRSAVGQFTLNRHLLSITSRPSGNVVNAAPLPGAGIDCGAAGTLCADTFDYGTPVTLRATAGVGFTFVNWTGGACASSANPTCAFVLKANTSVTPNFRARTLVAVVKAGNGVGTVSGPGISCGADCSEPELDARPVRLTAAASVGSRFVGFGDACVSNTSACTFTPAGDSQTVTATFELIAYTVTVANRPNGTAASTNALPDGITCGAGNSDCVAALDFGTQVALQATPITGSRFVNWSGTVCNGSTNTTCAFKIPAANVSVSPNFKDVTTLTLTKGGLGTIASTPAGISCGTTCTTASVDFARGSVIKLTPTPAVGWSFDGFSGACAGTTCSVNASAPTALVGAGFSIQHRRLTVTVVGNGTVSGPGLSCDSGSTPCAPQFDYGTSLALTATAAPGHRFTGWSQGCSGVAGCAALMTIDRAVTATFKPQFGLTVTKPGNSTGTITATASPAGIPTFTCGVAVSSCSTTYLGGQLVTLTRSAPVTGTTFQWGGDCAFRGTNATCALTLNADASVSADYSLQRLGLTVARNGAALGTVTGLGGAIDCGGDCSEVVNYGTPVVLLATPSSAPAAEFVSWAGCATAATNPSCSFTMTAIRTVTATFRPLVASVAVQALSTSTLAVGGARQLSAVATFTDGSTQDVTTSVETVWTSSAPAAAVSKTGLVTAKAIGNTSVMATFRGHGGVLAINVDALLTTTPPAFPIVVSCSPYGDDSQDASHLTCLPGGVNFSVLCQAMGTYASGSQDVTDQVTWSTSSAAMAQSTGLVAVNGSVRQSFRMVGVNNTTAILRATLGAKTSSTTGTLGQSAWVVQGVTAGVTDVQVTPALASVAVGNDLPLVATATLTGTGACAAPPPRDFSRVVTWTSSAENLAEVSFFGEVTGIAPGVVTITATYPIVNGPDLEASAFLTVLP